MKSGVKEMDESLRLSEANSNDNSELHTIVQSLFETINVIEQNSAKNGHTLQEVTNVTAMMADVIQQLANSSNQVDITANKLQQLVSEFTVSYQAKRNNLNRYQY